MSADEITLTVGVQGRSSSNYTPVFSDDSYACTTVNNSQGACFKAYFTNTVIKFTPADGYSFQPQTTLTIWNSSGSATELTYTSTEDSVTYQLTNNQTDEKLTYNCSFWILKNGTPVIPIGCSITAYPCKLVTANFDPNATPWFTYSGDDIDTSGPTPTISCNQISGVIFTLNSAVQGATFASEPFVSHNGGLDGCFTDIATDGTNAVIADLFTDTNSHSIYLEVTYNNQPYESEDPTIVNVTPSPDGG